MHFATAWFFWAVSNDAVTDHLTKVTDGVDGGGFLAFVVDDPRYDVGNVLKHVHSKYDSKVLIFGRGFDPGAERYFGTLKLLVVLTSSLRNVDVVIDAARNSNLLNGRSRVLIVTGAGGIGSALEALWEKRYVNVAISSETSGTIATFTYNGFRERSERLEDVSSRQPFYDKYRNVNGNVLNLLAIRSDDDSKSRVRTYPNGTAGFWGRDVDLFRAIVGFLNGTLAMHSADDLRFSGFNPWRLTNDNRARILETKLKILREGAFFRCRIVRALTVDVTGSIDMLTSEELILGDDSKGATESLYPHTTDDLMILLRRAEKLPHYLYLAKIFKPATWLAFVSSLVLAVPIWSLLGSDVYTFLERCIYVVRTTTGGPLPRAPPTTAERVFVTFWLLYALIIATAFVSNLATSLMDEKYYDNIDTIDEFCESGLVLSLYGTQRDEIRKAFDGTQRSSCFARSILHPSRYSNANASLNNYTSMTLDYAPVHPIAVNHGRAAIVLMREGVGRRLHMMRESPLPNYLAFVVPKGSPMVDVLNELVRKSVEGGLFKRWKAAMMHDLILAGYVKPDDVFVVDSKIRALSLRHVQGAFVLLGCGLGASGVVFVLELAGFRLREVFRSGLP